MNKFKRQAVIANEYLLKGGQTVGYKDKSHEPTFEGKIYSLKYVSKINSDYANRRKIIEIDWVETAKRQQEAGNTDWKEVTLREKEKEVYSRKRKINFPTQESYTLAIEMGEVHGKKDPYIYFLEKEIEELKAVEFGEKPKKTRAKKTTTKEVKEETNDEQTK